MILEQLQPTDWVVVLDEKGKQNTSVEFSNYLALISKKRFLSILPP